MSDRPIKLRDLRKILTRFGVREDSSLGKGSHTMFFRKVGDYEVSYPVPTSSSEILAVYVRGLRKRFKLTAADDVSDDDFYGK